MRDRLYRSREDRVLFGVAGGVAEWLDVDPSLVRIVFALLVLTAGIGFLLYIVMALVIPETPYGPVPGSMSGGPAGGADPAAPGAQTPSWHDARAQRRAERRAARAERGGQGALVIGVLLVLVGAWFLIRRYVPALDGDLLWPIVLIILGGVLLVGALGRGRRDDGPPPPAAPPAP